MFRSPPPTRPLDALRRSLRARTAWRALRILAPALLGISWGTPLLANQTQGRWQGPYPLASFHVDIAIHLAVLRGNADSTIVL